MQDEVKVREIETVAGDFLTEAGVPFYRVEIDGFCADFDYREAAENFANAINQMVARHRHQAERETLARMEWKGIDSAPKDRNILVWFDHNSDPYQDPQDPNKLTPYSAWADGGDFMDGSGICIAKWHPPHFEAEDEYGTGYWMPAAWFAFENADYERVCNATHWMPLPPAPEAGQ